jgi:hypothetical protein
MTSSTRSGLRTWLERRYELTTAMAAHRVDVRAAYWHMVMEIPKMPVRRLFSVDCGRIRYDGSHGAVMSELPREPTPSQTSRRFQ